jgi:hypothetical protein
LGRGEGVELLGAMHGSAYRDGAALGRCADGQMTSRPSSTTPNNLTLGNARRASVRKVVPEPSESAFTAGRRASVRFVGLGERPEVVGMASALIDKNGCTG